MSETVTSYIDKEVSTIDIQPDWDQVNERIEILNFPNNDTERAQDVAQSFKTGTDIQMFARALHEVLLPGVSSMPADRTVNITNKSTGESKPTLNPNERDAFYDEAAKYIQQIDAMRESIVDDREFLRRSAYVVGLAIVGAHTFENGNGRTARTLAELIRFGTENPDDIQLSATERDVSTRQRGGNRIFSFQPTWQAVNRGDTIHDTLRSAASTDIPLSEKETYLDRAQDMFTNPYLRT